MGVTFCAVAPEHPLALHAAASQPGARRLHRGLQDRRHDRGRARDAARRRACPPGLIVEHPLSREPIPLWVGNYVLMGYGDGAVMGVPAHDERDFAFAKKYGIDLLQVIARRRRALHLRPLAGLVRRQAARRHHQLRQLQRPGVPGRGRRGGRPRSSTAASATRRPPGGCATGASAASATGARRSRSSIATRCGVVPVPEKDLPVVLPEDLIPDGSGNPLNKSAAFLNVACPKCGKPGAARDRHDGHLRRQRLVLHALLRPGARRRRWSARGTNYWMPMDQYIGGIEHAILHLLYARFWTKVMRDLKLVEVRRAVHPPADPGHGAQPRLGPADGAGRRRLLPARRGDADRRRRRPADRAAQLADGSTVEYRGMLKMGKSKSNGVDPQEQIDRYGADTARLFVMFASPPEQTLDWNDAGVEGANRFLQRLWKFGAKHADAIGAAAGKKASGSAALRHEIHAVLQAGQLRLRADAIQHRRLRGDEAAQRARGARRGRRRRSLREGFGILLRALYPVCPHITWALWGELGYAASSARCSTRPGRRSTSAPWCRTRSSWCCRSTASCAARSACRRRPTKAGDRGGGAGLARVRPVLRGRAGQEGDRRAGPAGQRRRLMTGRRAFVLAFAASTLTACGFELRRAPELRFKTIQLTGFPPRSPLADDLKRNIDASTTTQVVEAAKDAEVVLEALEEERQKTVGRGHGGEPGARVRAAAALSLLAAHGRRQGADPAERDPAQARPDLHRERGPRQGAGRSLPLPRRCRPTSSPR